MFFNRRNHFLKDSSGMAYLEFALAAPFLMALFVGGIELSRYMLIDEKVQKVAVTVSDAASQGQTIARTDLDNIFTAANQIMKPFSFGASGYVIVTSVTQTGTYSANNPPKVNWQYSGGGTWTQTSKIGQTGYAATLPTGITLNDKDNIIITEVYYNFYPLFTKSVLTNIQMYQIGLYKPRLGALTKLSALQTPAQGGVL